VLLMSNVDEARSAGSFQALAGAADWRGYQALEASRQALVARVWPSLLRPLQSRAQWMASLETSAERAAWDAFVERPLGEAIERYVQDDLVRGLVFTDAKIGILTHPHDAALLQNRCFFVHVTGQGTGEWQVPVGGMGALADALAASAQEAGARLITRASVETIHPGAPCHTVGFRLEGDDREYSIDATRVLVNAGPGVFARLLGQPHGGRSTDEGSVCKVNLLLSRLPRVRADVDSGDAFCGTFHVDESYSGMQTSYRQAAAGQIPERPPFELYCHTLTDGSILSPALRDAGYHTLTLFGLDAPYSLFESDHDAAKAELLRRYLGALNAQLAEPIEDCLAADAEGESCIEVKTPQDLERELAIDRGNIFHGELSWFFSSEADIEGSWGVETSYERIYRCGSSATRGGAVSGIPGHSAARCIFEELGLSGGFPSGIA
jgi:phytoene dehydrogenase-like protein